MLDILLHLQRSAPSILKLLRSILIKSSRFPEHILPEYLEAMGVPYYILERDTYSVVRSVIPEGKPLAGSAADCGAARCTGLQNRLVLTKLRWDTIATTLWRRSFSTCSLVGS